MLILDLNVFQVISAIMLTFANLLTLMQTFITYACSPVSQNRTLQRHASQPDASNPKDSQSRQRLKKATTILTVYTVKAGK